MDIKNTYDDRLPNLLLSAIFQVEHKMKWGWLENVKNALSRCNLLNYFNYDSDFLNWCSLFKCNNKQNDHMDWKVRTSGKSSLINYHVYKDAPFLEPYLLDQFNFKGINLKFKARSNSLNLEGNKKAWSDQYSGIY